LKIILTRDYEKLGNAGDIVNVKDGFAKNFLIPNNIALFATRGSINQMEIVKKSLVKKEVKNIEEAKQVAALLSDLKITFTVNSSPEGKLYGSITNKDIAEKILEERKIEVDKKKIELPEHIKEVGEYDIEVKLYKDVKTQVKVIVISEDIIIENKDQSTEESQTTEESQIAEESLGNNSMDSESK
jgi:large subunit ribosomal protein L9